jgi:putative ABC transport system substrate-binding protein
MEKAAQQMGVSLQVRDIRTVEDIDAAFEAANKDGAHGGLVTEESMFIVHRARLAQRAAQHKLPVVYPFLLPVTDAGGLMAYAVEPSDLYRQAAGYVDRIFKGAKVADLPVQQPASFNFVINLKAASALGLTIPNALLLRATDLLE